MTTDHPEVSTMDRLAHNWTLIVGGDGEIRGYVAGDNRIVSGVRMDDRDVEVVPADRLAGAVEALREWLDADDAAERDYNDQTGARLDAAMAQARSIVGGQ